MEMMHIVWLVALVAFLLLEAFTLALVSIWFCAGALAALLVSLFVPAATGPQIIVFVAVSILALILFRPLVKNLVAKNKVPTNADANIGKVAQVLTDIHPTQFGRVKLEGLEWMAKSSAALAAGSLCRVESIEGAKLVVNPL